MSTVLVPHRGVVNLDSRNSALECGNQTGHELVFAPCSLVPSLTWGAGAGPKTKSQIPARVPSGVVGFFSSSPICLGGLGGADAYLPGDSLHPDTHAEAPSLQCAREAFSSRVKQASHLGEEKHCQTSKWLPICDPAARFAGDADSPTGPVGKPGRIHESMACAPGQSCQIGLHCARPTQFSN